MTVMGKLYRPWQSDNCSAAYLLGCVFLSEVVFIVGCMTYTSDNELDQDDIYHDYLDSPVEEYEHMGCRFIEPVAVASQMWRVAECQEAVAHLLRPHPPIVVVSGQQGSGRTSLLGEVAASLGACSSHLRLIRFARDMSSKMSTSEQFASIHLEANDIIAIDDFDRLTRIAWNLDKDFLAQVYSHHFYGTRFLLTVTNDRFDQLAEEFGKLNIDLCRISLSNLDQNALRVIVQPVAVELASQTGVTITDEVIDSASLPPKPTDTLSHPGLAVHRIEVAIGRALAGSQSTITIKHLDPDGAHRAPTSAKEIACQLGQRVFGQDAALEAIARHVAPALSGLKLNTEAPHAVMLFAGPSGVGKTETAKQLARVAYGSSEAVIRLDMSEYAGHGEDARIRLIGSSKTWKNSTTEGLLTTKVRDKPNAVLLLDEFEKASSSIWSLFLQVFDEGRLTDGWGQTASFSNTIIIMTSNLGAREATQLAPGFGSTGGYGLDRQLDVINRTLSPEFMGRLSDTVVFQPLDESTIRRVAERELNEAAKLFAKTGWRLQYGPEIIDWLATTSYDPAFGARHVQRNISRDLLSRLTESPSRDVCLRVGKLGLEVTPVESKLLKRNGVNHVHPPMPGASRQDAPQAESSLC